MTTEKTKSKLTTIVKWLGWIIVVIQNAIEQLL